MNPYETGLATLFVLWLALTAVAQLGEAVPRVRKMRSAGPLRLVFPAYNFFAPVPGTTDAHLLVRLRGPGEGPGPWRELTDEPVRTRWNWVWNPDRREYKQMADLADHLARADPRCEAPSTVLSVPYLLLLNRAAAAVARSEPPPGTQVQFLLAHSHSRCAGGGDRPDVRFLSRWHPLPGRAADGVHR